MMSKFLLIFSLVGVSIPIIWLSFWGWAKNSCEQCVSWLMGSQLFDVGLLLVWPSSLLLMADPTDSNLQLQVVSVVVNIVFYMILGWLTWLATSKSLMFFLPIIGFYIWWLWFVT